MSRSKGTFNFAANFEPLVKAPLDSRMLVGSYEDLVNPDTWKDNEDLVWLFTGAIVVVSADPSSGVYWLKDADNYTNYDNWEPVGTATSFDPSSLYDYIDGSLALRDSSISDLYSLIQIIDSSIEYLVNWNTSIDASLIRIDGSLNIIFNNLDSIDASIIELRSGGPYVKEASLGEGLVWNTITGLLDVSIDSGSFAGDISTSHVFYDPALDPSLAMPAAVGGIPAGTTVYDLQGDSLRSLLNDLLFPTVNPTYVAPSGSFGDNVANLQEIGAIINPQFTASFSRGQILVSGNFQDYRSGLPNQYVFTDASANTLLTDASSTSLSNVQTVNNYLVKIGNQSFGTTIFYDEGPQPYDNKGNPYGTPLAAGSVGAYSTAFEGVYPLFATTSNIATLIKQTLVSMLLGNNISMTLVAETGGNKQKFEIPTAWTGSPTSRSLVGVQQYNTFSSQWDTPGGSLAASLTLWSTSSVTESVQGNTINYTQYTYNGTDRGSVQIRLVF